MKNVLLMIFVFVFIVGCNDFQGQPKGVVKVKQFHYSNGGLKKEIPYNSSGQIHGIVREWLDDGRLFVEVEYMDLVHLIMIIQMVKSIKKWSIKAAF